MSEAVELPQDREARTKAAIAARKRLVAQGERVPVAYREATVDDLAFVLDTWAKSYRSAHAVGPVPKDVYDIEQDARMRRLILRGQLLCAVNPEAHGRILGWALYEAAAKPNALAVLHYILVRPNLQDSHIGTNLLAQVRQRLGVVGEPLFVTHFTPPLKKVMDRWAVIYNPYILEVSL